MMECPDGLLSSRCGYSLSCSGCLLFYELYPTLAIRPLPIKDQDVKNLMGISRVLSGGSGGGASKQARQTPIPLPVKK